MEWPRGTPKPHAVIGYEPFRNRAKVSTMIAGFMVVRQDKADAAIAACGLLIAELEAEAEHKCDDCLPKYGAYQECAEQAEAELAALQQQFDGLASWAKAKCDGLEVEIERLKVCGNCLHFAAEEFQFCAHPETLDAGYDGDMPYYISAPDKCDFTPTRWEART